MKHLLVLAFLLGFSPAVAQEIEQGTTVACDTVAQMEQLLELNSQKMPVDVAIAKVNGDKYSCGIVTIAFYRGKVEKSVMIDGVVVDITHILVIGQFDGTRWLRTQPTEQYMLFKSKDRGA